jgi:DNA-binding NtrC family response regulator
VTDTIPSDTMEALVRHSWPGNIRELQNLAEHSVILSSGPVCHLRDFSPALQPLSYFPERI